MKKYILFAYFSIVMFGCSEPDYKYFHSQLYSVRQVNQSQRIWFEETAFFKDIPISIKLENRIDVEDYRTIYQGRFEYIINSTAILSFDKDIVFLNTTFQAGTNLLETQYASIELFKTGNYPNYYILWINKENSPNFYTSKGYYTVYFKAKTENNYNINDSTVICIE